MHGWSNHEHIDNIAADSPSNHDIQRSPGRQEFDDAEPVLLILPVRLEIVFVLRSHDGQTPFPRVLAQNSRYTDDTQSFGSFVFPTAIYRALRCDRCLVITT
jgi:hypothetical protein